MVRLPEYKTLVDKQEFFQVNGHYVIDNKSQLDDWYRFYTADFKKDHPTDFVYRGCNEAKFKIYSSAQRNWILDNIGDWRAGYSFKNFIEELVIKAKSNSLIKNIFDLYGYSEAERDFPIISLLQHYGAPSPVVDWTYDINSAIYFAIDGVKKNIGKKNIIGNYMSVYLIDKRDIGRNELLSLLDIATGGVYPSIETFRDFGDENSPNANVLFTLSDFETTRDQTYTGPLRVRTSKPLTSLYNQNIIAQRGLLMYNPFMDRPIEQLFNVNPNGEGQNLELVKFKCFNIHKDLSEYLRRKVQEDFSIKKSFIYPNLYDDVKSIKENLLNSIARS